MSHLKSKLSLPPPQLLFLRCEAASCVEERQPGEIIFARLEKNIFVCALMLLQHWGNHLCWPREKHLCLQCIGNITNITKIYNCNVEKIIFAALKKKTFFCNRNNHHCSHLRKDCVENASFLCFKKWVFPPCSFNFAMLFVRAIGINPADCVHQHHDHSSSSWLSSLPTTSSPSSACS